jgi:HAD superfamily hydrolase (TIGR01450 family)
MTSNGAWLIDLDGVVWLSGQPIEGSVEAIDQLRSSDVPILFVTNNSAPTTAQLLARLDRAGVVAHEHEIVTAAHAAASLVPVGGSAVCIADGGVRESLEQRNVSVLTNGDVDAVIVGWTRDFTYETLATAATAVRRGAMFIGTNPDPTHPTPEGLLPGTGAIIAAVEVASGTRANYAGKPGEAMALLVTERVESVGMVVGDQLATDGAFAHRLGAPFRLVLSGVDQQVPQGVIGHACLADAVATWLEER